MDHIRCQARGCCAPWAQTALAPWVAWTKVRGSTQCQMTNDDQWKGSVDQLVTLLISSLSVGHAKLYERLWKYQLFNLGLARFLRVRPDNSCLLGVCFWPIATNLWDDFKHYNQRFPTMTPSKRNAKKRSAFQWAGIGSKHHPLTIEVIYTGHRHKPPPPGTSQRWAPRSEGDWPLETWGRHVEGARLVRSGCLDPRLVFFTTQKVNVYSLRHRSHGPVEMTWVFPCKMVDLSVLLLVYQRVNHDTSSMLRFAIGPAVSRSKTSKTSKRTQRCPEYPLGPSGPERERSNCTNDGVF